MARTQKVSLTIDAAVLADVKKRARVAKKNLSTFVSEALADAERQRRLREALEGLDREFGPVSEAELRKAEALLDGAAKGVRKRRRKAA